MSYTYGNTGNEGQRGDDSGHNLNTYGNLGNEPSRHRGNSGGNDDCPSTTPSRGGGGWNGGVNGGGQSYGGRGNEPSRHNGGGGGPFGPAINEPSRHRDIQIFVHPGNRSPVSHTANLDWTLDQLHRSCAQRCSMDPSQCHSSCAGVPVSGSRKVCQTSIGKGSTVIMNMRLRGG